MKQRGVYTAQWGVGWDVVMKYVVVFIRYGEKLKVARNVGIKKGFFTSCLVGGIYFVIFSTYALGFW